MRQKKVKWVEDEFSGLKKKSLQTLSTFIHSFNEPKPHKKIFVEIARMEISCDRHANIVYTHSGRLILLIFWWH